MTMWTWRRLRRSARRDGSQRDPFHHPLLGTGTVRGLVAALGACETGERLEISLFYALKMANCIQSGIFFHLKG